MFTLENRFIKAIFDERGSLTYLENKKNGKNIIEKPDPDMFFMNFGDGKCNEILAYGSLQDITGEQSGNKVIFRTDKIKADGGLHDTVLDVSVTLFAELSGDKLIYTSEIVNNTDKYILDFEYPRLGKIKSLGNGYPSLMWPEHVFTFINNAGNALADMPAHRENGAFEKKITYPGFATMGLTGLCDRKSSLILSIRDKNFISAVIKAKGYPEDRGCISLIIDKNLCVKNKSIKTAPVEAQFYEGDWKKGAKDYACWMNRQRPAHEKPDWAKKMNGFFLVINKQQFGYEMWDYDSVPELYDKAAEWGFDVLSLFGWYSTGHDNNYPDLEAAESLGGAQSLKKGIEKVHEKGGKVTLYYQGHLIDIMSDYYRSGKGKKVSCKTIWGTEYLEFYIKSHRSDFNAFYSRRVFTTACYSCGEWRDLMAGKMHWIASFGADGTIYDQLGGVTPYVCFDPRHRHDGNNPARAITGGQRKLLARLQNESKSIKDDFTFMSEHITDVYSPYLDMVHGLWNDPGKMGQKKNEIGSEKGTLVCPDVFRYCFPDSVITVRNPNPFIGRRMAGYAFVYGFPLEMEIRYEKDRTELLEGKFDDLKIHSKKVAELRKKYFDDIAYDKFAGDSDIKNENPMLYAMEYKSEKRIAVTLWNDSEEEVIPEISVGKMKLVSFETEEGMTGDRFSAMKPQSVAVAVFE